MQKFTCSNFRGYFTVLIFAFWSWVAKIQTSRKFPAIRYVNHNLLSWLVVSELWHIYVPEWDKLAAYIVQTRCFMEVFIISCYQTCTPPCLHEHEGHILITGVYWSTALQVLIAILGYHVHRTGNVLHLQCAYTHKDMFAITSCRRGKWKAGSGRESSPEPQAWAASALTTELWLAVFTTLSIYQQHWLLLYDDKHSFISSCT